MRNIDVHPDAPQQTSSIVRAAFYGRYSTSMQRPASLEDQKRACAEYAERKGMILLEDHCYTDAAASGATKRTREAYARLEKALTQNPKPFDCVLFDDTSRCARDQEDILAFTKSARFRRIEVHFVAQALDSNNPQFDMMLGILAAFDQQHNQRLAAKSFAGQKGRVLNGFHCGSEAYGYRSIRVPDPSASAGSRQSATLGSKLTIVIEEAEIVRRIFQMFADGESTHGIARLLNQDKIPSPQNSRARKPDSHWRPTAIQDILCNEKYKGVYVWNRRSQWENPKTGQLIKIDKPAHEVIRLIQPEIRILTDDLWDAAARIRAEMQDRQAQRVKGGYNRAVNQPYLYSGFLLCGECSSKLIISGIHGKGRYTCSTARMHRGCTNFMSVSETALTKQLTNMLASQLLVPEIFDPLVTEVLEEIKATLKREDNAGRKVEVSTLEKELEKCVLALDNLVAQVERGTSDAIMERIRGREREKALWLEKIRIARGKQRVAITRELLEQVVGENLLELTNVLRKNVTLAKQLLSDHMLKLHLYPDPDDGGQGIFLTGEFDLLSGTNAADKGVLLQGSGTRTLQQHAGVLYFVARFDASEEEPCLYFEPLIKLLEAAPGHCIEPKMPGELAELLSRYFAEHGDASKKPGYGAIARCFRVHADLLGTRILVDKIPDPRTEGRGHLYGLRLKVDGVEQACKNSS